MPLVPLASPDLALFPCRRNCRGNPNCLVGIGEQAWLGEIDEDAFHNIEDPNAERRKKNAFVGLTNLGATCYVNTFLQMWFLNLELRQALYLCPSPRPSGPTAAEGPSVGTDYEPQSICEHLQYLFALLQSSRRRYIDPSGFVKALGLDTGQQQDAQEFSKLFMSLLEDTLSSQKNPEVRDIVQKQFCGEYAYVTVCNQCGRESKLISKFYELELNIQGHKQLSDCITEFLKFSASSSSSGDSYDFVSLEWLQQWLDEAAAPKPVDNQPCLCPHGKLHPDKVPAVKRVSATVADYFYQRYGGGPRLTEKALCRECVVERCRILRLKNQLNEDHKAVSNLLKANPKEDEGFWVGKPSLRSWRQLALEQMEAPQESQARSNGKVNGEAEGKDEGDVEKREEEGLRFNEDIVCPHGNLCTSEGERRVVSREAWETLQRYFPSAPEFPSSREPCSQCKLLEREGAENEALHKMMAGEQKACLSNLFQDKNRPVLSTWPQEGGELYVVPRLFVEEWRKFVRRPTRCRPVSSVGNRELLCPHGGLMFTFASMAREDSKLVALLWPSEWERIRTLFVVDQAIRVLRRRPAPQEEGEGDAAQGAEGSPSSPLFITEPELCLDCREGLLCQQQRDLREYAQATIYVRKVVDSKKVMKEAAPELAVSSSEAEEEKEEEEEEEEELRAEAGRDPDFSQANSSSSNTANAAKRPKLTPTAPALAPAFPKQQGVRRSARHRKVRGEKALLVSANQTLKDLKIQIMHAFSVAPFDQNLSIDGKVLTDDSASLGSLGVTPESVVLLKADEPIVDYAAIDDVMQVCMPEEGFKGTGLLGH
nr:ubiquitin carboxyl-terminal hydrolase 48-like [Anolis sagrei ordinatus]